MDFDYERETKSGYLSDEVAGEYHRGFTGSLRLSAITHWVVAQRERAVIRDLLERIPHKRIIDIPCGTGKLAPVFEQAGSVVLAADVSPNMLTIAKREYTKVGSVSTRFRVLDVTSLANEVDERFE